MTARLLVTPAGRFVFCLLICLAWYGTASAQPPFGGGDRGDRGGDRGDRGGDRGGFGGRGGGDRGGGGGFDPSGFLSRLDRNGNGILDPDEQEGPASFLIRRLESIDPKIKAGSPIPLKQITDAFEKMRSGGGSSGDGRDDRGGGSDRDSRRSNDSSMEVELLVPGFGNQFEMPLLPGFGPAAEMLATPINEDDRREAREILARYDRNQDGQIDKEEIGSGRWRGNPMDFDRNADGKLSETELATRNAVRRIDRSESGESERGKTDRREESKSSVTVDFKGRRSYRIYNQAAPEGMPRFFAERDLNGDGQVVMSEYTSDWTDARIAEFYNWDSNGDGVITTSEVRSGVNRGAVATDAPAGTAPAGTSTVAAATTSTTTTPVVPENLPEPSEKSTQYAERIIARYDTNKDGAITASEWANMPLSPASSDFDGDGRVTPREFAIKMELRRSGQ